MSNHPTYRPGDWNAVCSICGGQFKASEMREYWTGLWRCPKDWEPRHPQELIRPLPDVSVPAWTQPRPQARFIQFCTPNHKTALPGFAIPGCVIPGTIDPAFDPLVTD